MGIYGPRTVFCFALADAPGCHEFLLMDDGSWQKVKDTREISSGKLFAPGNLRATFDNPEYEKLVSYWVGEQYTLRYTGGMVPDVFQIVVKEKGVFSNVTSPTTKVRPSLAHSRTHSLTHSRTHSLTHSRTHARTHSRNPRRSSGCSSRWRRWRSSSRRRAARPPRTASACRRWTSRLRSTTRGRRCATDPRRR